MKKIWHLTLTRATNAPRVAFKAANGAEVIVERGKITQTTVDLGVNLSSTLLRVIRVEERHKEVKGAGARADAMPKRVSPAPAPKKPEPIPEPVVEAPPVAVPIVAQPEPESAPEPVIPEPEPETAPEPVEEAPKAEPAPEAPKRKRATCKKSTTTRKRTAKKSD